MAEVSFREMGVVTLAEALELTALIAFKDPAQHGRAAARWLRRTGRDKRMPFARKSQEEKDVRNAEKQAEREAKAREKLRLSFYASPAGQARIAFDEGAHVFQYESDVRATRAVVKKLGMGSSAIGKDSFRMSRGPVDTLNAVSNEGWELISGSFVFVETGEVSRNKALSSGQQVAISGKVVGYYLFKRNEDNRSTSPDPWDLSDEQAVELAEGLDS